jgi:hypothetical protein
MLHLEIAAMRMESNALQLEIADLQLEMDTV